MKYFRYSSITLFFSFVLLFAGFHGASAETPGQPETNSTATDSDVMSAETTTLQNPRNLQHNRHLKPAKRLNRRNKRDSGRK